MLFRIHPVCGQVHVHGGRRPGQTGVFRPAQKHRGHGARHVSGGDRPEPAAQRRRGGGPAAPSAQQPLPHQRAEKASGPDKGGL